MATNFPKGLDETELYIGMMSGTSMDAVDVVLARFSDDASQEIIATLSHPIPEGLREDLATLSTAGGDTIDLLGQSDGQFGLILAEAALALLDITGHKPEEISAIGSHGQTVRHRPTNNCDSYPFTLQIGDPNVIATRTGITTVADLRRADMAVGGQGAPMAPAYHDYAFRHESHNRVVLNIGGMANITWLPAGAPAIGYDTGPGNRLMDYWTSRHRQQPYDADGEWARQFTADSELLDQLKKHHFFHQDPPKSTGREAFNEEWLQQELGEYAGSPTAGVVQATLLELTVSTIADAITALPGPTTEVFVCGGGVHNDHLMTQLQSALEPIPTTTTDALGVDPDWVEALAFAWLARQTLHHMAGNLPAVTGATRRVVLGGIYLGNPAAKNDPHNTSI